MYVCTSMYAPVCMYRYRYTGTWTLREYCTDTRYVCMYQYVCTSMYVLVQVYWYLTVADIQYKTYQVRTSVISVDPKLNAFTIQNKTIALTELFGRAKFAFVTRISGTVLRNSHFSPGYPGSYCEFHRF